MFFSFVICDCCGILAQAANVAGSSGISCPSVFIKMIEYGGAGC